MLLTQSTFQSMKNALIKAIVSGNPGVLVTVHLLRTGRLRQEGREFKASSGLKANENAMCVRLIITGEKYSPAQPIILIT